VRLEAVGKRYGLRQPWVVRHVSQDIGAGQLIRLEGPNGSGKSTLLRVMAGVSVPSAGKVTGRPRVGYVPERFPGGLAFSAREYLHHMARIHGLAGPAVSHAVDEWLDRLGAADYAGSPLRTLSKGMCQKIAIAQALLGRPGLLVLDEAWTGLDQAARGALDMAVAQRLAAGATVLFVDHDLARLAGMVSARWQLSGGAVTVEATGRGGINEDRGRGRGDAVIVVQLSGIEAGSLPQLARLPGAVSVSPDPIPGGDPAVRLSAACLTVDARHSDEALRQLLSWDGVHVIAVRPAPEASR
jgi:ABC-2 type transport system ATP-binding protein